MYQIFLGPIRYVLEFSILHPYFFLAWRMALDLANLCFRLMWILWKKACGWLEACNHWLALNRPNMCLLMRVGYAMLISECFWLELCLIVELMPDFTDFLGTLNGNCWHYQKNFRGKDQEPQTWKSSIWFSLFCKSGRKYWRWLL